MTAHTPIQRPQDADQAAAWNACLRSLSAAVDVAERVPGGQRMIGEALCAALETVGGGSPAYDAFGNIRDDAAFWADTATPMELEAYAAAALRRIPRATFAESARKRLFWSLWETMPQKAKDGFLSRVSKERRPP